MTTDHAPILTNDELDAIRAAYRAVIFPPLGGAPKAAKMTLEQLGRLFSHIDALAAQLQEREAQCERLREKNDTLREGIILYAEGSAYITELAPKWERDYWRIHVAPVAQQILDDLAALNASAADAPGRE